MIDFPLIDTCDVPGDNLDLPKLHALEHFSDVVEDFGSLDGLNTENQERLHIEFAKDAYAATNKRDHEPQMVMWLERREKMSRHFVEVQQRLGEPLLVPLSLSKKPTNRKSAAHMKSRVVLAKKPSAFNVSFETLISDHGAKSFEMALKTFVTQYRDSPGQPRYTARRGDANTVLPFTKVDVWFLVKFELPRLHQHDREVPLDIAFASPCRGTRRGRSKIARFDTVLVKDDNGGESSFGGVDGEGLRSKSYHGLL